MQQAPAHTKRNEVHLRQRQTNTTPFTKAALAGAAGEGNDVKRSEENAQHT